MSIPILPRSIPLPVYPGYPGYNASCAPGGTQPTAVPPSITGSLLERPGPVMKTTLANGTQGYVMQKPGSHKASLNITIPTIALPPGVDDLLGYCLLNGSMVAKRQLEAWREQGIRIGGSKGSRYFTLEGDAPAGQELVLAKAMMEVLTKPVMQDPAVFNTLKARLMQIQQRNMVDPDAMLDDAIARRLYGTQHPYGRSSRQIAADQAKQTLPGVMAYHPALLKLLGQGNVMMVSSLPAEAQRQILMSAFSGLPSKTGVNANLTAPPDNPKLGRHRNLLLTNESVKRALIKTSWQVPDPRDPDYAAFILMRSILCDVGEHSFFKTLRTNHGLVYAIQYDTSGYPFPQGETFTPSIKVEFSKIGQAIEDLKTVTQGLCQEEVSPAQLQTVQRKQLLKLRQAAETADMTMHLYQPWLTVPGAQLPNTENMEAAINRVTPADIKRVANRIFNNPNGLQLLGVSAPTAVLQQWFPGQPLEKIDSGAPQSGNPTVR
jgi:predicted Zn-dependent peptidase